MQNYHCLLQDIRLHGEDRGDRTGTGTRSLFGRQLRYDLRDGFPLMTTKRIHWKSVVAELLWMISGSTNVRPLQEQGVRIWDEWADATGDLGRVYGAQWRAFRTCEPAGTTPPSRGMYEHDQLEALVKGLKDDPQGRRHVVSAWNSAEVALGWQKLPPCHMFFQCYAHEDGGLSLQMYQRSADVFLGVPFNIASYALLLELLAQQTGRYARELIIDFGDVHIYNNHFDQVASQMNRALRALPTLEFEKVDSLFDYTRDDIHLLDYNPHPGIKAQVSV